MKFAEGQLRLITPLHITAEGGQTKIITLLLWKRNRPDSNKLPCL